MNRTLTTLFYSSLMVAQMQAAENPTEREERELKDRNAFDAYCIRFGREYTTTQEYEYRLQNYIQNKERMEARNAKHTSAHFEVNVDAGGDLSPEEFEAQMLGSI